MLDKSSFDNALKEVYKGGKMKSMLAPSNRDRLGISHLMPQKSGVPQFKPRDGALKRSMKSIMSGGRKNNPKIQRAV